jgi:hypothetical protein
MLKTTVTVCDYIGLHLIYNYLKKKKLVCFNVKLKMMQTYVITQGNNSFEQTKKFSLKMVQ